MWPYTCRWSEKGDNCMENHVSQEKKKREREKKKKKRCPNKSNQTKPNDKSRNKGKQEYFGENPQAHSRLFLASAWNEEVKHKK